MGSVILGPSHRGREHFSSLISFLLYSRTKMVSLDLYTQNIPLTQKAKFWSNYISSLKGNQDLRANEPNIRNFHPSVVETLPNDYPELKMEFSKLESQMFDRPLRRAYEPLTPVIADANERINTLGYSYSPVDTDIYGRYRPGGQTRAAAKK